MLYQLSYAHRESLAMGSAGQSPSSPDASYSVFSLRARQESNLRPAA
jgi:hypothetical protein